MALSDGAFHNFINSFNTQLEPPVRQHLKNVYTCLTMSAIAAAVGTSIQLFMDSLLIEIISAIGVLVCLFLLMKPDENCKNVYYRVGYLLSFATFAGIGLGSLLEHAMLIDPTIIITALIGTSVAFISFSICSILSEQGKWLYLGGTLLTLLNTMLLLFFANIFLHSTLVSQTNLYLGLILMCGFVLYNTQSIIEKRRMGNKDFVAHSLNMFLDFIGIFRRILIILTQKAINDRSRAHNENAVINED